MPCFEKGRMEQQQKESSVLFQERSFLEQRSLYIRIEITFPLLFRNVSLRDSIFTITSRSEGATGRSPKMLPDPQTPDLD
ncbi:hypothetical protein COMA2_170026 [Candidatus Nitrospira nitrificans]|uniref:Uncharacterized protein n=1 Tax=Candidatus Nitrospira nitrificans TaxID=1742973 RepID=A0A0S4LCW2_9BACT|nr:hypothetical protein COMA2_170026 [Candidatus Nitrospira nitrificans]